MIFLRSKKNTKKIHHVHVVIQLVYRNISKATFLEKKNDRTKQQSGATSSYACKGKSKNYKKKKFSRPVAGNNIESFFLFSLKRFEPKVRFTVTLNIFTLIFLTGKHYFSAISRYTLFHFILRDDNFVLHTKDESCDFTLNFFVTRYECPRHLYPQRKKQQQRKKTSGDHTLAASVYHRYL